MMASAPSAQLRTHFLTIAMMCLRSGVPVVAKKSNYLPGFSRSLEMVGHCPNTSFQRTPTRGGCGPLNSDR